jgi:hypothetical protein
MRRSAIFVGMTLMAAALLFGCQKSESSASAAAGDAPSGAAVKDGWWIKINTGRTDCDSITLQIGPDETQRKFWFDWRRNDAPEFDVPADYRQVFEIYLNATANPKGKHASFCLMYKTRGVKKFEFDNDTNNKEKQTDLDADCID